MGQLHCGTMQRSMLAYEGLTVDTYNGSARKGFADDLTCFEVIVGLAIGGYNYLVVGYQEIDISGRQP